MLQSRNAVLEIFGLIVWIYHGDNRCFFRGKTNVLFNARGSRRFNTFAQVVPKPYQIFLSVTRASQIRLQ